MKNQQACARSGHGVQTGRGALFSGANAMRALVLAGGVVLHAVNVYIVTTILPTVVQDIGGLDLYAWNTTLFVVASILGSALSPKLLALTGPKGSYAVAALIFAVGRLFARWRQICPFCCSGASSRGLAVVFSLLWRTP